MHPEVVDDRPGRCPICRMNLEPVRLDTVWSCPIHSVIAAAEPGRCPICGRELVHTTVAVSWTCPDWPGAKRLEPGSCADGSLARIEHTPRPHGNHNPQHGGVFFMAPDNWHHVEGVYASAGLFRLYVYDDYSKPVPPEQRRRISAVVATATGTVPLTPARERGVLEARVGGGRFPVEIGAKVRFTPGSPEYRFDFTFAAPSVVSGSSRTPRADEVRPNADEVRLKADATPGKEDLVAPLRAHANEIAAKIQSGAFGEVYVPAFAAKDLALAIEQRASGNRALEGATSRLVRAAWMLDAAADAGDREQIAAAYTRLNAAITEIEAALGRSR